MKRFDWLKRLKREIWKWIHLARQKRLRKRFDKELLKEKRQQERLRFVGKREYERRLRWQKRKRRAVRLSVVAAVLALCAAVVVGVLKLTEREYVLTNGEEMQTITMLGGSVEQACERAGLESCLVISEQKDGRVTYVTLSRKLRVSVRCGNQTIMAESAADTVENILANAGIQLGVDDFVIPDLDEWITSDTNIEVVRVTYHTEVEQEDIPFEVEQRNTDKLVKGQQRVLQYGEYGVKDITYEVAFHNGREADRTKIDEEVSKEPVNCIVENGTSEPKTTTTSQQGSSNLSSSNPVGQTNNNRKLPDVLLTTSSHSTTTSTTSASSTLPASSTATGNLTTAGRERVWSVPCSVVDDETNRTLTTADGVKLQYSSVFNVKATAYHRVEDGGLITATGTTTDYGTIAVDPRVIPLNSRVYVVSDGGISWSYGPGKAEDTGGLIKGTKVDLFFMTGDEADDFGIRDAKIYILKE